MSASSINYLNTFFSTNPGASADEITSFLDRTTKKLLSQGEFEEAGMVANQMVDRLTASGSKLSELLTRRNQMIDVAVRDTTRGLSPAGVAVKLASRMSAGKITAIVAGVGIAAAGIYAVLHKKAENPQMTSSPSWVDRVQQQRIQAMGAPSF